jgi:hypothetical protein
LEKKEKKQIYFTECHEKTLDKDKFCRVPYKEHSVKKYLNNLNILCRVPAREHSAKYSLSSVRFRTLGKERLLSLDRGPAPHSSTLPLHRRRLSTVVAAAPTTSLPHHLRRCPAPRHHCRHLASSSPGVAPGPASTPRPRQARARCFLPGSGYS